MISMGRSRYHADRTDRTDRTDPTADLTIGARFCGPARSGNDGYTAGSLAERMPTGGLGPVVEVTLRLPPPLDTPMQVRRDAPVTVLFHDGARVAEARESDTGLEPVDPVPAGVAADAMSRFPGLVHHPFPTCYACGTARAEGDGLRIFPGQVGETQMAALWVPHERVGVGTTWAALDCIGGWAGDMEERKMVLGRMTAQLDALPVVGEPHVVVGRGLGHQGRKTFTASTLYDSDGTIVARARQVWIAVDPDAFN